MYFVLVDLFILMKSDVVQTFNQSSQTHLIWCTRMCLCLLSQNPNKDVLFVPVQSGIIGY